MIVACAVLQDGRVYCGPIAEGHPGVTDRMTERGIVPAVECEYGYMTDRAVYLDRRQAAVHAYECGQIASVVPELASHHLEG